MDDLSAAYYHHHHPPPPPSASHYPYYAPPATAAPPQPSYLGPPPYSAYSLPPPQQHQPPPPPSEDELRTLFIAGLPDDVKHREIYNLFREFPGYQSCNLRTSGKSAQAYGFAVFTDQHSAVTAMHALNGIVFDLEREATLHIDLAKSNSKSKRPRTDESAYFSDKKVRDTFTYSRGFPDSVTQVSLTKL